MAVELVKLRPQRVLQQGLLSGRRDGQLGGEVGVRIRPSLGLAWAWAWAWAAQGTSPSSSSSCSRTASPRRPLPARPPPPPPPPPLQMVQLVAVEATVRPPMDGSRMRAMTGPEWTASVARRAPAPAGPTRHTSILLSAPPETTEVPVSVRRIRGEDEAGSVARTMLQARQCGRRFTPPLV